MNLYQRFTVFSCLLVLLSGCAGFVGGDLEDVRIERSVPYCGKARAQYELSVQTDAEHDYADQNIAGYISMLTLGIIPTYWLSFESSHVEIISSGNVVYQRKDKIRIHKFYGILWPFILDADSMNALRADEGAGLRIPEGIKSRAIGKTLNELPENIDINNLCLKYP